MITRIYIKNTFVPATFTVRIPFSPVMISTNEDDAPINFSEQALDLQSHIYQQLQTAREVVTSNHRDVTVAFEAQTTYAERPEEGGAVHMTISMRVRDGEDPAIEDMDRHIRAISEDDRLNGNAGETDIVIGG